MPRPARARVAIHVDGAREATITIDRAAGLFMVRPLRRKKFYELPLSVVAEMVIWKCVKAEVREKKAKKRVR